MNKTLIKDILYLRLNSTCDHYIGCLCLIFAKKGITLCSIIHTIHVLAWLSVTSTSVTISSTPMISLIFSLPNLWMSSTIITIPRGHNCLRRLLYELKQSRLWEIFHYMSRFPTIKASDATRWSITQHMHNTLTRWKIVR